MTEDRYEYWRVHRLKIIALNASVHKIIVGLIGVCAVVALLAAWIVQTSLYEPRRSDFSDAQQIKSSSASDVAEITRGSEIESIRNEALTAMVTTLQTINGETSLLLAGELAILGDSSRLDNLRPVLEEQFIVAKTAAAKLTLSNVLSRNSLVELMNRHALSIARFGNADEMRLINKLVRDNEEVISTINHEFGTLIEGVPIVLEHEEVLADLSFDLVKSAGLMALAEYSIISRMQNDANRYRRWYIVLYILGSVLVAIAGVSRLAIDWRTSQPSAPKVEVSQA